ncbi:MAG: winged helix-turn-helix transcriptional regulator [Candidatus Kariarchaeaceae archaeon]
MTEETLYDVASRISKLLGVISKKWVIEIIICLLNGHLRFNKLQDVIPEISGKELSEKLKLLFELKIVDKVILNAIPTVITYQLTEKGDLLRRNLLELYLTSLSIDKMESNISENQFVQLKNQWENYLGNL